MSKYAETKWTTEVVCPMLRRHNALVFAIVGSEMQVPGWPDRYVCHKYWSGWLEFKGTDTKLRRDQAQVINELNERNPGHAFICRKETDTWGRIEDTDGRLLARFRSDVIKSQNTGLSILEALILAKETYIGEM